MHRTLTLRREALAPLADGDLAVVVGGAVSIVTCPVFACVLGATQRAGTCASGLDCPTATTG